MRSHARRVLVPHKANGYRPHLIRLHGLVAVLTIALLAQVVYGFVTTGHFDVLGRVVNMSVDELVIDTNAERAEKGLPALEINETLNQAAALKANDMITANYWAHTSPTGVEPWKWFEDAGYKYTVAGENLAKNYPTAESTVSAWMNSETHRANILNDKYTEVGFAVVQGSLQGDADTTLVVALYGAPLEESATVSGVVLLSNNFTSAAVAGSTSANPLSYFGSAIQSLSPVTIIVLGLFAVVAIVGAAAHHYRDKLPKNWRQSWKSHHGMYTFWGIIATGVLVILATGGGQL